MPYTKFPKLPPFAIGLNKLVLYSLMIALISCKKQKPIQSLFYDVGEIMILNDHVKQVIIPYDSVGKNFYLGKFDPKGDLEYTISRFENNWEDKNGKHSEINTDTLNYSATYDPKGKKVAITVKSKNYTSVGQWAVGDNGKVTSFRHDITDTSSSNCMSYYKYDAKGDLSEYELHFCKLKCPELYRYKFDKNHLLIELSFYEVCDGYEARVKNTCFEYKAFDTHKNWTKRVVHYSNFRHQTSTYTETRKITYY